MVSFFVYTMGKLNKIVDFQGPLQSIDPGGILGYQLKGVHPPKLSHRVIGLIIGSWYSRKRAVVFSAFTS